MGKTWGSVQLEKGDQENKQKQHKRDTQKRDSYKVFFMPAVARR